MRGCSLLIGLLCMCHPALALGDELWFGAEAQVMLQVPRADSLGEQYGKIFQGFQARNLAPAEQNRLASDLADLVFEGFSADSFLLAVFDAPLDVRQKFRVSSRFGDKSSRGRLYRRMWELGIELRSSDINRSNRLLRASLLLSLIDFVAVPRFLWLERVATTDAASGSRIVDSLVSDKQWDKLVDRVASVARSGLHTAEFASKVPPLYSGERMEVDALASCLDAGADLWRRADCELMMRCLVALEYWQLKCRATADNDSAAMERIRSGVEVLSKHALDPVSRRWVREILEKDGPKPRRPSVRVAKPEDFKPATPD